MLRILYGIIGWVFLICFVNYASIFVEDYITDSTEIPTIVQEHISKYLNDRYETSEQEEVGTGEDEVMKIVPFYIKEKLKENIQETVNDTILLISQELTASAIKGISTIISVVAGILIIVIIGKVINLLGIVPGIREANKLLGLAAGFFEGMLITWLIMYIASCFPASLLGQFVIENAERDQMLYFIYQNNLIAKIIGI